jgi:DNA-3-methyladenine glycosylase
VSAAEPLGVDFFARDVQAVARDLIGRWLRHGEVVLRITETEAYHQDETGCHAWKGRTARNASLFGPPGTAYVYLCYGIHHMLNLVCDRAGYAAAALIRAAEPVSGLDVVRARRGGREGPALLTGPGKVGQALGLDLGFDGHPLCAPGGLEVLAGAPVGQVRVGPRVGIDYARPEHRDAPWRYAAPGTRWISHPKTLRP